MKAKAKKTVLPIGSISEGTLRTEGLIDSLLYELKQIKLTKEERTAVRQIEAAFNAADEDSEYWEEQAGWDLDALYDIANAHCPDYTYFGGVDGDPASVGVWVDWSSLEDADDVLCVSDRPYSQKSWADVPKGYSGYVLYTNDHFNSTLYRYTNGRQSEVWAVV